MSTDDRLMRVTLAFKADAIEPGPPEPLFSKPAGSTLVHADGQRFLFFTTTQQAAPITLLLNWKGQAAATR